VLLVRECDERVEFLAGFAGIDGCGGKLRAFERKDGRPEILGRRKVLDAHKLIFHSILN